MRITTKHPESCHGFPVVLDDTGAVLETASGVRAARERLGLSRADLAAICGASARTVENWEQGRQSPVPANALNVLGDLLRAAGKRPSRRRVNSPDTPDPS